MIPDTSALFDRSGQDTVFLNPARSRRLWWVLVATLTLVASSAATPVSAQEESRTVLEHWDRVQATLHEQGCASARALAGRAITSHPRSPALVAQYFRIEVGAGGIGRALASLDSLRSAGFEESVLLAGDYVIAVELGQNQRAAESLASLEQGRGDDGSRSADSEGLDHFWLALQRARVEIGSTASPDRADSLLESLEIHPFLQGSPTLARDFYSLLLDRVEVTSLLRNREVTEALDTLAIFFDAALDHGYDDLATQAAFHMGRLHVALQQWAEAADRLALAAQPAEELGHVRWQAIIYSYWGLTQEQLWRFPKAVPLRQKAVEMLERQGGDPVALAHALLGLGWCYWRVGDPYPAELALRRSLSLFRETNSTWGEIQTANNLALVHHYTSRRREAMAIYEEVLEKARATGNTVQEEMVLNNIGILHQEGRRPDLALPVYQDLLARHRASGNTRGELLVLNNLALVTRDLGQAEQARVLFEQCLERRDEVGGYYDAIPPRINLGHMLIGSGEYEAALTHLRRALEESIAAGDQTQQADVRFELGNCLDLMGRHQDALEHIVTADQLLESQRQSRVRLPTLSLLARVRVGLGLFDEALAATAKAESLAVLLEDRSSLAYNCARTSHILLLSGHLERARTQAREALRTWREARQRVRPGFDRQLDFAFYTAATTLLSSAEGLEPEDRSAVTRDVFEAVQHFKSRTLLEYVETGQRRISAQVPDSLAGAELRCRLRVDRIRTELEAPGLARATFDSLRFALAEAETEHQNVRGIVFANDPRFARAATATALTLDEARTRLAVPGTLVLDFVVPPVISGPLACPAVVFVLDSEGLRAQILGTSRSLRDQISLLLDVLDTSPASDADPETARVLLDLLSDTLLGPAADRLAKCRELIVSPDGMLHRVPFAALRLPDEKKSGGHGFYVVERTGIVTTPSLDVLDQLRSSPASATQDWTWDLTIWSEATSSAELSESRHGTRSGSTPELAPLRFAAEEEKTLLGRFSRARAVAAEPSEDPLPVALAGLFDDSRIVHFIAHGFFDDRRPWRSGLYLDAPAPGMESRRLEIGDVYTMDLRSQLVTLSACDMAKEELGAAIGWRGFARALFGSGARSVLATLWSIDDASTPLFMTRFYEHLADGKSRSESLRLTQLSFLEDDRLRHPFYWAPYVLLGEGRQGVSLAARSRWMQGPVVLLALGALLLILAALVWRWLPRGSESR